MLADVCRQCMITMDVECISTLCMLQKQRIEVTDHADISSDGHFYEEDVQHKGIICLFGYCKITASENVYFT